MGSVIDAYAILFNLLGDSVCEFLTAMRYVMTHVIAIAVLAIILLSTTFYTMVTTLRGVLSVFTFIQ